MVAQQYFCLFARHSDKKHKTWRDGMIYVQGTQRFARVSLYETDNHNHMTGPVLDTFDLFNIQQDNLTGQVITSPRFVVKVCDLNTNFRKRALPQLPAAVNNTHSPLFTRPGRRTPALGTRRRLKQYRVSHMVVPTWSSRLQPVAAGCDIQSEHRLSVANQDTSMGNVRGIDRSQYNADSSSISQYRCLDFSVDGLYVSSETQDPAKPTVATPLVSSEPEKHQPLEPAANSQTGFTLGPHCDLVPTTHHTLNTPVQRISKQVAPTPHPIAWSEGQSHDVVRPFAEESVTNRCTVLHSNEPLGKNFLVHLINSSDDASEVPPPFDEPPIVDSELLDCIESALGHFGESKRDSPNHDMRSTDASQLTSLSYTPTQRGTLVSDSYT
ncbi:uncharacterized protein BXIN_2245 [Babesia sp. Xinjiang]|uniref:uncharacterized protein n=1 Tax=Babesia sp. Xinjiang TaxID=462227 RepID=UPI000A2659C1|nr:uncharacterized protein BXIN_2245 [Babesia sp. Xinjiang]ORM40833.1 hypothetical protein BXIN_2245 [Babesia sp. Xinjiang]